MNGEGRVHAVTSGRDSSGPNARVIDVMNFLAARPTESFTLTEIALHLGLSNGSAHRVLTTLAESQYLSRHPKTKTYSLGMALGAQPSCEAGRGIAAERIITKAPRGI